MHVTRLKGENNLTELVDRLFDLDRSTIGRREIAAEIADANPHLDLKLGALTTRLDPGALIAVPEIEGAVTTRAVRPVSQEAARVLFREAAQALASLPEAARENANAARAERDSILAELDSSSFKRAVGDDSLAKDRARELRRVVVERTENVEGRVDAAEEAITEARLVIERMLKLLP